MGGLILIAAFFVWVFVSVRAAMWVYQRTTQQKWKAVAKWFAFPLILILPLGDEIVGEVQLRYLCSQAGLIHLDEEKGRNAVLTMRQVNNTSEFQQLRVPEKKVSATVLDTTEYAYEFYADGHKNPVIQYKTYSNGRGWFSRNTGISIPFVKAGCNETGPTSSETLKSIFEQLNASATNWN